MTMSRYLIALTRLCGRMPIRTSFVTAALATGLVAGAPAVAQDYPARDVGEWTVAAGKDKEGCFLTRQYPRVGGTTLLLGLDIDGTNHLSVLNANWSIKPRDTLNLDFRLSGSGYPGHAAVGMAADGKQGFVTTFEAKFLAYFAASPLLGISRGDVKVEQLRLDGSGAAVAELRRCVWIHKAKPATKASGREQTDTIPTDPFAPEAKRKSKK